MSFQSAATAGAATPPIRRMEGKMSGGETGSRSLAALGMTTGWRGR